MLTGYRRPYRSKGRRIGEAVILSFSDQQLITGLSILIAVRYFMGCEISAYHYDVVCNLVLMSVVTHLSSLAVISGYFSNFLLGACRIVLIIFTLGLAGVMFAERDNQYFPTGVPRSNASDPSSPPQLLAPAACFTTNNVTFVNQISGQWNVLEGKTHISGLAEYVVLFIFTISGLVMAITHSYLSSSARKHVHLCLRQWMFVFRIILLLGAIGVAIAACHQFNALQDWMHASPWPADNNEREWNFGQLVPLFLILLAPLQFIEALTGKLF